MLALSDFYILITNVGILVGQGIDVFVLRNADAGHSLCWGHRPVVSRLGFSNRTDYFKKELKNGWMQSLCASWGIPLNHFTTPGHGNDHESIPIRTLNTSLLIPWLLMKRKHFGSEFRLRAQQAAAALTDVCSVAMRNSCDGMGMSITVEKPAPSSSLPSW